VLNPTGTKVLTYSDTNETTLRTSSRKSKGKDMQIFDLFVDHGLKLIFKT